MGRRNHDDEHSGSPEEPRIPTHRRKLARGVGISISCIAGGTGVYEAIAHFADPVHLSLALRELSHSEELAATILSLVIAFGVMAAIIIVWRAAGKMLKKSETLSESRESFLLIARVLILPLVILRGHSVDEALGAQETKEALQETTTKRASPPRPRAIKPDSMAGTGGSDKSARERSAESV